MDTSDHDWTLGKHTGGRLALQRSILGRHGKFEVTGLTSAALHELRRFDCGWDGFDCRYQKNACRCALSRFRGVRGLESRACRFGMEFISTTCLHVSLGSTSYSRLPDLHLLAPSHLHHPLALLPSCRGTRISLGSSCQTSSHGGRLLRYS